MAASDLIGAVATVITIGMFLSNAIALRSLPATKSWGPNQPAGAYGLILSASCWTSYGLVVGETSIIVCNMAGFVIGSACVAIFATYAADYPTRVHVILRAVQIVAGIGVIVLLIRSGIFTSDAVSQRKAIGYIAATSSVIMFASPLAAAVEILRRKDASVLSPLVLGFSITVCTLWTLVGLTLNDTTVSVPNALGGLIVIGQIVLRLKYPPKVAGAGHRHDSKIEMDAAVAVVTPGTEQQQQPAIPLPPTAVTSLLMTPPVGAQTAPPVMFAGGSLPAVLDNALARSLPRIGTPGPGLLGANSFAGLPTSDPAAGGGIGGSSVSGGSGAAHQEPKHRTTTLAVSV